MTSTYRGVDKPDKAALGDDTSFEGNAISSWLDAISPETSTNKVKKLKALKVSLTFNLGES
jgi:hypothetical protein